MRWQLNIKLTGVPHPFVDLRTEKGESLAFKHSPDMTDLARFRMKACAPEAIQLARKLACRRKGNDQDMNDLIEEARKIQREVASQ